MEKSAFELELLAQFIEFESGKDKGLQWAITFIVQEQLALMKSAGERDILKKQISEALNFSKAQEHSILEKLDIPNVPGKYYFNFDFTDEKQRMSFLSFYGNVTKLLQLRYIHNSETLQDMTNLLEKWFSENHPIVVVIEVEVIKKSNRHIRNIRIREKTSDASPELPLVSNNIWLA